MNIESRLLKVICKPRQVMGAMLLLMCANLSNRAPASPQLLNEAHAAWASYRNSLTILQGSGKQTFSRPNQGSTSVSSFSFERDRSCFSYTWQPLSNQRKRLTGRLTVENPNYRFELTRPMENAAWAIANVSPPNNSDEAYDKSSAKSAILQTIDLAIRLDGSPFALPELTRESDFVVNSMRQTDPVTGTVRLDFEYPARWFEAVTNNGIQLERRWNSVRKGWIDLKPQSMWLIGAFDVEAQEPDGRVFYVSGRREYIVDAVGPLLAMSKITSRKTLDTKSDELSSWIWEYQMTREKPNSSVFTLTHFGFLEPEWATRSNRSGLFWFAGIGCLLALVFVTIFRRRRGRLTSDPSQLRSIETSP